MSALSRADNEIAIRWVAVVERIPEVEKIQTQKERLCWVVPLAILSTASFFFIPAGSQPTWFLLMTTILTISLGGVAVQIDSLDSRLKARVKDFGTAPAFYNTLPDRDAEVVAMVAKGRVQSLEFLDYFLSSCSERLREWSSWETIRRNPALLVNSDAGSLQP